MCLELKYKELHKSLTFPGYAAALKTKKVKAFKIYKVHKNSFNKTTEGVPVSFYYRNGSITLHKGVPIVSNREAALGVPNVNRVTQSELNTLNINFGVHAFLTLAKAKSTLDEGWEARKCLIVEVEVEEDDFIGVGTNEDIVANKMTPVRVVEYATKAFGSQTKSEFKKPTMSTVRAFNKKPSKKKTK